MVIEYAPLEDELGDVLEKAMRCADLTEESLSARAGVDRERICAAFDYRYDFTREEIRRLADVLGLNDVGVAALACGHYPLPTIGGLPFCLYALRTPFGIGVANAYIVAECNSPRGILFDTGSDAEALRRVWPAGIKYLDAVFITHPETEHLGGLSYVQRTFGPVPVYGPASATGAGLRDISEDVRLILGGVEIETFATPGHSESHNCYLLKCQGLPEGRSVLVSGDILFAGSIGGAYFCKQSLKLHVKRLLALPDDTVVAPGHGPLTTIKNERTFNPFVF